MRSALFNRLVERKDRISHLELELGNIVRQIHMRTRTNMPDIWTDYKIIIYVTFSRTEDRAFYATGYLFRYPVA